MITFLTLPQELRDKILTLAIEAPLPPPQPPAPKESHQSSIDKYTFFHGRINAIPTLLVNSQLHHETTAAINRLPNKHSYDLDILLVNEDELWPTWLLVPALTSQVEKVRATFRYFEIINKSQQGPQGFRGGAGGPPLITWSFYDLLTRFFLGIHRDWHTNRAKKPLRDNVSIKLLELDVRSPNVPAELIAPDVDYRVLQYLREESGVDYVINPKYFATFIENHLERLLEIHIADYGCLLYERIGTIKVYLDGELRKEWNIGNLLATMKLQRFAGSFEYPKPHPREHKKLFKKWRKNAYNSREQFGLPIMPFQEED